MPKRILPKANAYVEATLLCMGPNTRDPTTTPIASSVTRSCATDDPTLAETCPMHVTGVDIANAIKAMYMISNATVSPS